MEYTESYYEWNRKVIRVFGALLEQGMSAQEALAYLDYDIFVRNNAWFESLSQSEQDEIRHVIHAIKLVHVN